MHLRRERILDLPAPEAALKHGCDRVRLTPS